MDPNLRPPQLPKIQINKANKEELSPEEKSSESFVITDSPDSCRAEGILPELSMFRNVSSSQQRLPRNSYVIEVESIGDSPLLKRANSSKSIAKAETLPLPKRDE